MAAEWTGSSPELLVRLDRGGPVPLGRQLQCELREAIRAGRLAPGDRVPSTRALARGLGVSRGLVLECYYQLEAEGYLCTRPGSATRVAECAGPARRRAGSPPAPEPPRVDFRYGVPDLASFPVREWTRALAEAGRTAPVTVAGYGDPRGDARLREILAAYLRRVRAAEADPDQIVVCAGYAQGLGLVLRVLAGAGVTHVAVEDPGDRANDAAVVHAGMVPVPVPVDAEGIDVAALAATPARAVIVTPAHQCPTGVVLAPARRHALVAWANATGATVVEDDYDPEYRYDRQPVGVLQGLAPERVAVIGSVSKSLAPALRLGWVACPCRLTGAVAGEKHAADRGSPGLDQLALAVLLESGRYDRHLRRMRGIYGARRAALVDALARHAPQVRLGGLAAGFHATLRLPDGTDERAVVAAARERSVGLYGMSGYRSTGATDPPVLVLGFGNVPERSVEEGVAAVADLLRPPATRRTGG